MVYLVGAGPGDPGMVTLRAVQCLARADLVLYDYLVNPRVLTHAAPGAELVSLGRHGTGRIMSQDEIHRRLIDAAGQGKTVVRLKSGDPAVFARGAEEAEALAAEGIRFEVVPGITAALAAGSCAGIPITHRDLSSAVMLVTGQEKSAKQDDKLDYGRISEFPGTLVFYMAVTSADQWVSALLDAGKPADTPVAIIRRCSHPDQQTIRCRLDEVLNRLASPKRIRPPVIFVVGRVAAAEHALQWFTARPLFGTSVLVTRPVQQANSLAVRLEELGAEVILQPAIQISDPQDWRPVDEALNQVADIDWLVFSSANGVEFFLDRLLRKQDLRCLGGVKIAAIGPATARRLADYHLRVDYQPDQYRAEALAEGLAPQARDKRFLLVRASRGREVLREQLTDAGGDVRQIVVYRSSDIEVPDPAVVERLRSGEVDWVTVTSSAIARSVVNLFGDGLRSCRIASISPITSSTLRQLGHEPHAEAEQFTTDGVVQAIVNSSSH